MKDLGRFSIIHKFNIDVLIGIGNCWKQREKEIPAIFSSGYYKIVDLVKYNAETKLYRQIYNNSTIKNANNCVFFILQF